MHGKQTMNGCVFATSFSRGLPFGSCSEKLLLCGVCFNVRWLTLEKNQAASACLGVLRRSERV
jgi:hypothetical protein